LEKKNIFIVCSTPTIAVASAISQTIACHGFNVILQCEDDADVRKASEEIQKLLSEKVASQEISQDDADAAIKSIETTTDISGVRAADIIIESVFENEDLKLQMLADIDAICSPDAIIATNTSSLTVTHLASVNERPERIVGMHFIYFSPVLKVVEIAGGIKTSKDAVEAVRQFAADIGMEAVMAEDAPGLLSTRIWMVHLNEAANNVFNKLVEAQSLVKMNRTISPKALSILESADFIGLDNCVAWMQNLYNAYGDPKYLPSPLLTQMVDAGQLGIKSGKGFFSYS